MSDNDLMEDLEAAFDQHDEEATPVEETETLETASEEVNDDAVVDDTPTESTEEATEAPIEAAAEEEKAPEVEEKAPKIDKAPASWSPKAREAWGKVPEAARAQVAKREAEVNQVLQNSSQARKAMGQFNETLAPYKDGLMAAGHADPFSAINNILGNERTLRAGNAQEKAVKVAQLCKQYGVDINMLDSALAGEDIPQQAQQQPMLDPRVDQMLAQQAQQQQYVQQQRQQQANGAVAEFSQSAEFLPDVRLDMADMMDAAAKRGQAMDMEKAYNLACAAHPEISGILAERKQQESILGGTNALEAKRTAAGASLTGRQSGTGGVNGNMSLRETLEAQWPD